MSMASRRFFFQKHWELLRHDITSAVLGFLNGGDLPLGLNDTSITLIPKVRNPQSISQYRPISLCPVPYKIGAKMITNRLKEIMDAVVGVEQSAFVPVCLITDNVVVTFESIHTMRRRKKEKNYTCAIKLDMHKAYDRVEWSFLKAILVKLGFKENWMNLIMQCVSSVEYRIRFNADETDSFKPTRRLMQGDPL